MQKHVESPENLPLAPDMDTTPSAEDVHFREGEVDDKLPEPKGLRRAKRSDEGIPARSLQLKSLPMSKSEMAAEPRLLDVREVANRLRITKYRVYHLVAKRKIAFHRIGTTLRFGTEDVKRYLAACRVEANRSSYGRAQD